MTRRTFWEDDIQRTSCLEHLPCTAQCEVLQIPVTLANDQQGCSGTAPFKRRSQNSKGLGQGRQATHGWGQVRHLERPHPASHLVRAVLLRLPRAGAHGDSKQDPLPPGPSRRGKGVGREGAETNRSSTKRQCSSRPTGHSLTRETAPRKLPLPPPSPTGQNHTRHLSSQELPAHPRQERRTGGTAASRGPAPRRLEACRGRGPREGGSRGRPRPPRPHPSAPQRASPPAPPREPAFPARLRPGSARARLSPHGRRRAAGAACGRGQTPRGTDTGAAAPVLIPAPAFPAPPAPPAEPRLRDIAQARSEPAPDLRAPLGEEPRALGAATGSRGEGPSVAGARVPEAVPLVDGVFLPLAPRGSAFYLEDSRHLFLSPASPSDFRDVCDSC